jgi:MoaA/NifB/PqqE/SkfB family radical SAM enzyme
MNSSVIEAVKKIAATLEPSDQGEQLTWAFQVSYYDDVELPDLTEQLKAYSIIGHYYPHVIDVKRHKRGGDKLAWQFLEEYLEGRLKALDKGMMATMHANNMTGRHF